MISKAAVSGVEAITTPGHANALEQRDAFRLVGPSVTRILAG